MDLDWTLELLSDSQEIVGELLAEPPGDLRALALEVAAYRARIHREARISTDLDLADQLADRNIALLQRVEDASADARRVASVAARYFVREDDGESDLSSLFGFDDDVEVFNAAATRLAPELVIVG
jgi:hypothetical protein